MADSYDPTNLLLELRDAQREGWLRGERLPVEHYLQQHPALADDPEAVLDLIYAEVCLREELGESVTVAEYVARFPQYQTPLSQLFEVHGVVAADLDGGEAAGRRDHAAVGAGELDWSDGGRTNAARRHRMSERPVRQAPVLSTPAGGREQRLADFAAAHRRGERPSIDDHLAGEGDERRALLRELVQIDLESRLESGEPVRVEEYLQRYPDWADDHSTALDLICAEYALRRRAERDVPLADYCERFTQYREELIQRFGDAGPEQRRDTTSAALAATDHNAGPAALGAELPAEFGRYRILKELGGGGMGKVYLAHDTQLDRDIALKIPRFRSDESARLIHRFYREARAMAALRHQNLCTVHDVGEIQGTHYLTMAYIDGQALSTLTDSGRTPPNRTVAAVVRKLALALQVAHRAGVVHRDLKPANIIIDKNSQPVVVDFGLAHRQRTDEQRLTDDGAVMGTPAYMSPEQVEGQLEAIGPASDIYSLGVIFYQLLTGRLPFQGSVASLMAQILRDEPPRPSAFNPGVDAALERICLKALAKKPDQRFGSMEDMANSLAEYLKATAAGAVPCAAAAPAREDQRGRLSPREFTVLCPVCATRIDAVTDAVRGTVACPQCHTPITLQPQGPGGPGPVEPAVTASSADGAYRLAEPVERLPGTPGHFAGLAEPRGQASPNDTASIELDFAAWLPVNAGPPDIWEPALLARFLGRAVVRVATDIHLLRCWLPVCGLFPLFLLLTMHLINDIRAAGFNVVSFFLFLIVPLAVALVVLLSHFCLSMFEDFASGSPEATGRPEFDFAGAFRTCLYVLLPAWLALTPGYLANLVLDHLGTPPWLWLQMFLPTASFFSLFPIFFVSAVVSESPVVLWARAVRRSLRLQSRAWRLFYGASAVLMIPVVVCCLLVMARDLLSLAVAAVGLSALTPVYFQLLGRLAWRIAPPRADTT